MVVNQPSSPSLVASSRVSSSSAFYAASTTSTSAHENMEGANITNNRSSPMQYPQQELHSLQPRGEEEEKQQKHYQVTQQQQQQHYRPLVIVLAGPTAVGKSDVASLLCSTTMAQEIMQTHFANYQYNPFPIPTTASDGTTVIDGTSYTSSTSNIRGHIISADSVQVYRANIDIGSNKPSAEELLKTPYHLVGIVDPPNNASSTSLNAHNTATIATASVSSQTSASVYGAADWMNDVMYVLRSLPIANNNNHYNNNPEFPNNCSNCDDENNDDCEATVAVVDGALIQRRAYIDRDLYHNLAASSSSTIANNNDNNNNNNNNNNNDKHDDDEENSCEYSSTPEMSREQQSASSSPPMIILPVVTGGTMMYLQWLVHGRPDAVRPTEEAIVRAADTIHKFRRRRRSTDSASMKTEEDGKDHGNEETNAVSVDEDGDATGDEAFCWEEASTYVASLGPIFAKRVEKLPGRDWYRLRRLLEVAYTMCSTTRKKHEKRKAIFDASDNVEDQFHSETEILQQLTEKEIYTGIRSGSLADNGYDVRCFFLCPTDRMAHFHAVDIRCELMLLRGLLRECADLYTSGVLQTESQVSRAIGYRQALEYLTRKEARRNDGPALLAFVETFATATRQYAKKQMQWFRRENNFAFIPVNMDTVKEERVARTAQIIADMCKLHPDEYDSELSLETKSKSEGGDALDSRRGTGGLLLQTPSLSAQTRLENERQGKGMKYFLSKRVHLVDGSDDFMKIMAEADACTRLVQGLGEHF